MWGKCEVIYSFSRPRHPCSTVNVRLPGREPFVPDTGPILSTFPALNRRQSACLFWGYIFTRTPDLLLVEDSSSGISDLGLKTVRLTPKLGQDKSETFPDHFTVHFGSGKILDFSRSFSVHFDSVSNNALKMIWKSPGDLEKSRICPICGQSDPLWA